MSADDGTLFRIVYDSVVLLPFGEEGAEELTRLVERARQRNARSGVTGALRYDGAYFMQVLEGPRGAVVEAMARIQRDPRHTDVRILEMAPVTQRDFARWSMVLVTYDDAARTRTRKRDLPDTLPFRAVEVLRSLRAALEARTDQEPA